MMSFQSISEYATDRVIINLIAKERGKYVSKNTDNKESSDDLYLNQLKPLMPPRNIWSNTGKDKRPSTAENGLKAWTRRKRLGTSRVLVTILKYRKEAPEAIWVQELNRFISEIQDIISGKTPYNPESPHIIAKFKKQESNGDYIFRPICVYRDLKTKIVLALVYKYLLQTFNNEFDDSMLFMRGAQKQKDGTWKCPNYMDAIKRVDAFRKEHQANDIYVGECDIQKFYDILNHDVITACFESLFNEKASKCQVDSGIFDPVRNILKAYLESFDFASNVMKLNDDSSFWEREKQIRRTAECPDPVCKFKWVKEEDFIESGCYTKEEFEQAKENGKIGIPQGGAISGIIVNFVMRSVDKDIISPVDPDRFFVRYCDDILLLHTDRSKCEEYLSTYWDSLKAHKLLMHPSHAVSEFKNGVRTHKEFWDAKSKNVYLWGRGDGDASIWLAFVGYEMRRNGKIRIRKDKIDSEFKRIAKAYFQAIGSQKKPLASRLEHFKSVPKHILDFEMATNDRYTYAQCERLDKYLKRKISQAARKIGTDYPDSIITYKGIKHQRFGY